MSKDLHSLQGALAMAMLAMGSTLLLLGLSEYMKVREFKKWKERNKDRNFDIEN